MSLEDTIKDQAKDYHFYDEIIGQQESEIEDWKDRAFVWADNCKKMQKALIKERAKLCTTSGVSADVAIRELEDEFPDMDWSKEALE